MNFRGTGPLGLLTTLLPASWEGIRPSILHCEKCWSCMATGSDIKEKVRYPMYVGDTWLHNISVIFSHLFPVQGE